MSWYVIWGGITTYHCKCVIKVPFVLLNSSTKKNLKNTFISTSFGSCEFSGVCKTERKKNSGYYLRHCGYYCVSGRWNVHQNLGHQLFVRVNRMKKHCYCSKDGYPYSLDNSNNFDSTYLLDCGLCNG